MLSIGRAIIFGLLQGFTELFPISSLGHSVILPRLLAWQVDQTNPYFLTFLVATHAATALVLLLFFWRDWVKIVQGIFRSLARRAISVDDPYARLGWLLVVGTIPAGLLGVLFEQQVSNLLANPRLVAAVLVLNGLLLLGAEKLRRNSGQLQAPAPAKALAAEPALAVRSRRAPGAGQRGFLPAMPDPAAWKAQPQDSQPGQGPTDGQAAPAGLTNGQQALVELADDGKTSAELRDDGRKLAETTDDGKAAGGAGVHREEAAGSVHAHDTLAKPTDNPKTLAELRSSPESDARIAHLSWANALKVGVLQSIALIPGFSRTGSTMTGALLVGLSHEDAARFSFLLATPVIGAAALLKLPELTYSSAQSVLIPTLAGALAAGIAAYLSVRFLVRYFKTETLTPFGVYCIVAGLALSVLFLFR